MDDEISIQLFCHSSDSWLRLLLRSVKFCSNLAFRDTLLGTVGLADLRMDQMVLFFFCEFSEGWVC